MPQNASQFAPIIPLRAQNLYLPGLDGMRALAILIVLVAHLGFDYIVPGGLGVTIFFFVSGFLITRLLLAEQDRDGRIHLKAFYIRRFLRLMPAMYFFITLVALTALALGIPFTAAQTAAAYLYSVNYYDALHTLFGLQERVVPWGHLWSLAVEEHFYLLFPAALALCAGLAKRQFGLIIAMILLSAMARLIAVLGFDVSGDYTFQATEMRLESLAWGCLLALVFDRADASTSTASYRLLRVVTGALPFVLAALALVFTLVFRDEIFRATWRYSVQGIALFVLLVNLYCWGRLKWAIAVLEIAPLRYIGRLSYSLYLWHMVPIFWLHKVTPLVEKTLPWMLACVLVSAMAALASYYGIERPFFGLRKRYGGKPVENMARV